MRILYIFVDNLHMLQHPHDRISLSLMLNWVKSLPKMHLIRTDYLILMWLPWSRRSSVFFFLRLTGIDLCLEAMQMQVSCELGMIITLCDNDDNASVLHFSSWKSGRVTRSVLAAEVYALSECYDYCSTVAKLSSVSEIRLLIGLSALHQRFASADAQIYARSYLNSTLLIQYQLVQGQCSWLVPCSDSR